MPARVGLRLNTEVHLRTGEAHGFAVNLFVVVAPTVIAVAFVSGRPRLIRPALAGFTVLCLADWVLVQDLGFLGGLGTDPNSMIPFIVLAVGSYLALQGETAREARPARVTASLRPVAALGAAGLMVLGGALMTLAQASPNADPILAKVHRPPAGAPGLSRSWIHPHQPVREGGVAVQPARHGAAARLHQSRLPGPDLPGHRAGVPPGHPDARRRPGRTSRDRLLPRRHLGARPCRHSTGAKA
jgi:hypothetical protein